MLGECTGGDDSQFNMQVRCPGAVRDLDIERWISDAEVTEISYTAVAFTKDATTARLIVRPDSPLGLRRCRSSLIVGSDNADR